MLRSHGPAKHKASVAIGSALGMGGVRVCAQGTIAIVPSTSSGGGSVSTTSIRSFSTSASPLHNLYSGREANKTTEGTLDDGDADDGSLFSISTYFSKKHSSTEASKLDDALITASTTRKAAEAAAANRSSAAVLKPSTLLGRADDMTDVAVGSGADATARKHNAFIASRRAKHDTDVAETLFKTLRTERLFPMVPRLEGIQANHTDTNACQLMIIRHPDSPRNGGPPLGPVDRYLHTLVGGGDGYTREEIEATIRDRIDGHRNLTEDVLRGPDFEKMVTEDNYLVPVQLEPLSKSDLKTILRRVCQHRGLLYDPAPTDPAPTLTSIQKFINSGNCPPASTAFVADVYTAGVDFKSDGFAFVVYMENAPTGSVADILSTKLGIPLTCIMPMYSSSKGSTATTIVYVLPNYTTREHLLLLNAMVMQGSVVRASNITALPSELFEGKETMSKLSLWASLWDLHNTLPSSETLLSSGDVDTAGDLLSSSSELDRAALIDESGLRAEEDGAEEDKVGTKEAGESVAEGSGALECGTVDDILSAAAAAGSEGLESVSAATRDSSYSSSAVLDSTVPQPLAMHSVNDSATASTALTAPHVGTAVASAPSASSSLEDLEFKASRKRAQLIMRGATTFAPGKVFLVTTMLYRRVAGGSKDDIKQSMAWLNEAGSINYQPASPGVLTTLRCLLNDDPKKAFLSMVYETNPPPLLTAFLTHPTVENATNAMKLRQLAERFTMLRNFVHTRGDFRSCISRTSIRYKRRLSYTFDAFMINGAMSARIRLSNRKVLVGDFVVKKPGMAYPNDPTSFSSPQRSAEARADGNNERETKDDEGLLHYETETEDILSTRARFDRSEVHLITSEEEARQYSIADVVLPIRKMRPAHFTRDPDFIRSFAPPNSPSHVNTQQWLIEFLTQNGLEAAYALNTLSAECQVPLQVTSFDNSDPCRYVRLIATPYKMSYEIFEDDVEWRVNPREVTIAMEESRRAATAAARAATQREDGRGIEDHSDDASALAEGATRGDGGAAMSRRENDEELKEFEDATSEVFSAEGFVLAEESQQPTLSTTVADDQHLRKNGRRGASKRKGAGADDDASVLMDSAADPASVLQVRGTTSERLRLGDADSLGESESARSAAVRSWASHNMLSADSMRVVATADHVEQLRRCGLDKLLGEIRNPTNACRFSNGASSSNSISASRPSLDALTTGIPAFPNATPIASGLLLPIRSIFGLPEEDHLRQVRMRLEDMSRGVDESSFRRYKGTDGYRGDFGLNHSGEGKEKESGSNYTGGHVSGRNSFVVWGTARRRYERFVNANPAANPSALAKHTKYFTVKVTFFDPPKAIRSPPLLEAYLVPGRISTPALNVLQHDTHKNVNAASASLLHAIAATTRDVDVFDAVTNELFTEISIDSSASQGDAKVLVKRPREMMTRAKMREQVVNDLHLWRRDFETVPPRYSTVIKRTSCDICGFADHTSSDKCAVFKFHKERRRARKRAGLDIYTHHRTKIITQEKRRRALEKYDVSFPSPLADPKIQQVLSLNPITDGSDGNSNGGEVMRSSSSPAALQHHLKVHIEGLKRSDAVAEWSIVIDRDDPSTPWGFFANGTRLTRINSPDEQSADGRKFLVKRKAISKQTDGADQEEAPANEEETKPLNELLDRLQQSAKDTSDAAIASAVSARMPLTVFTIAEVNAVEVTNAESVVAAVKNNVKALDCEDDPESRIRLIVLEHRMVLSGNESITRHSAESEEGEGRRALRNSQNKSESRVRLSKFSRREDDGEMEGDRETRPRSRDHLDKRGNNADGGAAEDDDSLVVQDSLLPTAMRNKFSMSASRTRVFLVRRATDVRWGMNAQGLRLVPFAEKAKYFANASTRSPLLKDVLMTDPSVASSSSVFPGPPEPTPSADKKALHENSQKTPAYLTDNVFVIRGINDVRVDSPDGLHALMGRVGRRVLRLSLLVEQLKLPLIHIELDAAGKAPLSLPIGFSLYGKGRIAALTGDNTLFGKALLQQAPSWCNLRPDFGSKLKSLEGLSSDDDHDDDEKDKETSFLLGNLLYDRNGLSKAFWRVEEVNGVRNFDLRSLKDVMGDLKAGTGTVRLGLRMVVPVAENEPEE